MTHKLTRMLYHNLKNAKAFQKTFIKNHTEFPDPELYGNIIEDLDWKHINLEVFELITETVMNSENEFLPLLELTKLDAWKQAIYTFRTENDQYCQYFYIMRDAFRNTDESIKNRFIEKTEEFLKIILSQTISVSFSKYLAIVTKLDYDRNKEERVRKEIIEFTLPSIDFIISKNMTFKLWKNDNSWIFFGNKNDIDLVEHAIKINILTEYQNIIFGSFISKSEETDMFLELKYA